MSIPGVSRSVPCVTRSIPSFRRRIPSVSKRDSFAFAFLLAIGLTVTAAASAVYSGISSGMMQNLLLAAGFSQDKAVKIEQQRQSVALAQMERSLDMVRGQVARLATQTADATETARQATPISEAASHHGPAGAAAATGEPSGSPSDIDLTALRTSIDEHDERNRAAFAAVNKRIDWLETLVYARDATNSTPAATETSPVPTPSPAPTVRARRRAPRAATEAAPRWLVLHAEKGVAVISGKAGTIDVTPGYVIPELGRVAAIRMQDGHWQVLTEKATLSQR
jgi:hypothetical protein